MRTRANALPGAPGVAIADAVQTVPVGATGVDRDWRNAAKAGEGTFRAQSGGLSPAATGNCPAVATPMPGSAKSRAAAAVTSGVSWVATQIDEAWPDSARS